MPVRLKPLDEGDEKWMRLAVDQAMQVTSEQGKRSPKVGAVAVRDGMPSRRFVERVVAGRGRVRRLEETVDHRRRVEHPDPTQGHQTAGGVSTAS